MTDGPNDAVQWFSQADVAAAVTLRWTQHNTEAIPLDVGELGCRPPDQVLAAGCAAFGQGALGYSTIWRRSPLVPAILEYVGRWFGREVTSGRLHLASSTLNAVAACIRVAAVGRDVVVVGPVYDGLRDAVSAAGSEMNTVDLIHGPHGFVLDLERIEQCFAKGARCIVITNPHNPTGHVLSLDELLPLGNLMTRYDATCILDEVYMPINFSAVKSDAGTVLEEFGRVYGVGSTSKVFNLASVRLAWVTCSSVADREALFEADTLTRLSAVGHLAATCSRVALTECDQWLTDLRRDVAEKTAAVASLWPSSLIAHSPHGGFYVWLRCPDEMGVRPAQHLLKHAGVSVYPGARYSDNWSRWIRVNAASPMWMLMSAIRRIQEMNGHV